MALAMAELLIMKMAADKDLATAVRIMALVKEHMVSMNGRRHYESTHQTMDESQM